MTGGNSSGIISIETGNETEKRVTSKYPLRLVQLLRDLKRKCFENDNDVATYDTGTISNVFEFLLIIFIRQYGLLYLPRT